MHRLFFFALSCLLGLCASWPTRAEAGPAPVVTAAESQRVQLLLNYDYPAALRRCRELLAQTRHGQPTDRAEAYWLMGCALRDRSRFDSSIYYGQRALALYQGLGKPAGVASAYLLLAQNYKRLADAQHVASLTRQGLSFAIQAVQTAQAGGAPTVLSRAYIVQGIIYRDLLRYDSARTCYLRAMQLARRYPVLPSPLPVAYADYGQLLMEADKQLPQAIRWFRRTLPLYHRENNHNGLEHAYRNLSWAYGRLGDTAQAVATADTCLALGRTSGDPHRLNNSLEVAYHAYRAARRLPMALDLLAEWKSNTDQLASASIVRAVAAQRASHQVEQQAARITTLGRVNRSQRYLLWALGSSAAMLLCLLGLATWQYYALRRSNYRLSESSRIIEHNHAQLAIQSERLGVLLQEVHHRIKNNLATVMGLLRLQAARLTDPEALRAMRDSQQRIEAISLLHQGLYQTADVSTVEMRHYITDLTQSLWATYQLTQEVDLQLSLEEVRLDVDVAVPLGLLLNEVITNALKHAFADVANPVLRVAFGTDPSGQLLLEVQDNGPGFNPASQSGSQFGRRLIPALAKQLSGQLSVTLVHGTHYRLLLPPSKRETVEEALS